MAAGSVQIPWYATVLRGDKLAEALQEIAPVALRYNATSFAVYRSRDDRYKFLQMATFENKHAGKISILVGADEEGQGKVAEGPGAVYAEIG